jgi:hypothetical protein
LAESIQKEVFQNAVLDMQDLTITEYSRDGTKTYNLLDALDKWDGQFGITLTVEGRKQIAPDEHE